MQDKGPGPRSWAGHQGWGVGGGGGVLQRLTLSDMRVEMERPISW